MTGITLSTTKKTLLEMVQDACSELGLAAPQSIVSNTDQIAIQMLALAQREGREFYKLQNSNGGWQSLRKEYSFSTVAIAAQSGSTHSTTIIDNLTSTTGIAVDMVAVGNYIPVGARVVSVDSSTQVTLDTPATSTASGVSIYFGQDNYALPDDFAYFIQQTFWDRAFRWQLLGPLNAQEWQVLKSGISPTGPRRRFRIMSNRFYLDPVPADNGSKEVFEYYSNGWAQSSTGTAQNSFMADSDNYLLDDDCMILGLKWRFKAAKGLDYTQELASYEQAKETEMARDGGNRALPLNASAGEIRLLNNNNVPDTGFGT